MMAILYIMDYSTHSMLNYVHEKNIDINDSTIEPM